MNQSNFVAGSAGPQAAGGFYMRDNLASKGLAPSGGPYNLCPDLIQSDMLVADPAVTFGGNDSWTRAYGTEPVPAAQNYYYVRSMNDGAIQKAGAVALNWAPAQVFNFPLAWKSNRLETPGREESVALDAQPGFVAVGAEPFAWVPPAPPNGTTYFNFVAVLQDGITPIQPPGVTSWIDLAALIGNPQYGFRNEALVSGQTSWTHRQQLTVPASFAAANLNFMLVTSGFTGAKISLLADSFTPSGHAIMIAPTTVPGDGIVAGAAMPMEPGYNASLAIGCTLPAGVHLEPGATLALVVTCPLQSPADFEKAMQAGVVRHIATAGQVGPTAVAVVATVTFTVGSAVN
jgi:hypothetical protein